MLSSTFLILLHGAFLTLRLGNHSGSFPRPLSADEEKLYVDRWCGGDLDARNVLIEHNLRLVAHIVKKYYTSGGDPDDLVSIGTIGLIKGISTYRPDKGVRLATYASRCIENEILMHFRSERKTASDVSISEYIEPDSEGNNLSLMDILTDERDMTEEIASAELCGKLRQEIEKCLDRREADIIRMRYGLDGKPPLTQRETAAICGISRSYVSRLEKKALEKIKHKLEED